MPLETGFQLEETAIKRFADMKLGSKSTRYFALKIYKEEGIIRLEGECKKGDEADQKCDYETILKALSPTEGCFIVLDLKVEKKNGSMADQMFFICWNPDTSSIHSKTLYSSARGGVMKTLKMGESAITIQANDYDDIDYETLMVKAKR